MTCPFWWKIMITQGDQAPDDSARIIPKRGLVSFADHDPVSARFPSCLVSTSCPTMPRHFRAPHSKKETFMSGHLRHPLFVCGTILAIGIASTLALSLRPNSAVAQDRGDRAGSPTGKGQPIATKDISLDQAHAIIAAAVKKAQELKINQDVAVVDAGGNLKAFVRMDSAWLGSIDIAIKKAKTARFFDMPTGEIGKLSQPGKPLYQIEVSNGGLITFPGGIQIKNGQGTVIGAIGVSGSTVENDHTVADAGANAALSGGKSVTGRNR